MINHRNDKYSLPECLHRKTTAAKGPACVCLLGFDAVKVKVCVPVSSCSASLHASPHLPGDHHTIPAKPHWIAKRAGDTTSHKHVASVSLLKSFISLVFSGKDRSLSTQATTSAIV